MARNKRHVDQRVKKEEIEITAAELFKEFGYDKTSMTQVAKNTGIAPNTIYWYFENKDDLLVAVLNRTVSEAMVEVLARKSLPLNVQIVELINQLEDAGSLITDVHARVKKSAVIETWHDSFHHMIEQLSASELMDAGIEPDQALQDARVLIYVVEGLLAHPHRHEEREKVIDHTLTKLLGSPKQLGS